jgi:hypothetical protein
MEQKVNYKFKTREEYLAALDSVMPDTYIQTRDIGGGKKHIYLPQAIKEAIADDIFHFWNVQNENYTLIANELLCTVKLTFMPNYPEADEVYCTGTAAIPIQMDSGSNVMDFPEKKKKNALEYNAPAVRTEAIGSALNTLGNIFGRNLGRKLNKDQTLANDFKIRKHV